jgi:hypothetical protein
MVMYLGFYKIWGIYLLHEEVLASQEGLCSMELVSSSDNTASQGRVINDRCTGIGVKVVMAYFKILFWHPPEGTKVNREISTLGKLASRPRFFPGN